MVNAFVIGSGQSLTNEQCEKVRAARNSGIIDTVLAVNNAGLDMAPWADALVAGDSAWWRAYQRDMAFKGRKFCRNDARHGRIEKYDPRMSSVNSGMLAMMIARDVFLATRIGLLGIDLHGTHYHGPHTRGSLTNPKDIQFTNWQKQFALFKGPQVINCTPGTQLKAFPISDLDATISMFSSHADVHGS